MHDPWLSKLEESLMKIHGQLAGVIAGKTWGPLILRLSEDSRSRIDSLKASVFLLAGLDGRPSAARDTGPRKHEMHAQLNALRIAVIDLAEICENLAQSRWILDLGIKTGKGPDAFLDQFSRDGYIEKAMRSNPGDLLTSGFAHLIKVRNAMTHDFARYTSHVVPDGSVEATIAPSKFKLEAVARNPQGDSYYYDEVFDRFCQLGDRDGSSEGDFSRVQRNGLNAALFSAGRIAAELADALLVALPVTNPAAAIAPTVEVRQTGK